MHPADDPDGRPHVTLRYVTRFRCLGSACEDTCCSGWVVHVSERDYRNAERAVSGCEADRERFHRSFEQSGDETNTGSANAKPGPPGHGDTSEPSERFRRSVEGSGDETGAGPGPPEQGAAGEPGHWLEGEPLGEARPPAKGYARIRMRADTDRCPWLEDGLCGLQSRYGASALPDVCMVYPRMLSETPHGRETAGCLSCPEVARELLLHDDACSWVTNIPPLTDRRHVLQTQGAAALNSGYERLLDPVRAVFRDVLSQPSLEEAQKLFLLCLLASRVDSFFHAGAGPEAGERFSAETQRLLCDPRALEEAVGFIDAQEPEQRFSLLVVSEILAGIATLSGSPAFRTLVQDVFDHYLERTGQRVPGAGEPGPTPGGPVRLEPVLDRYALNMRRIRRTAPQALERAYTNLSRYFCFAYWYTRNGPNLTAYFQRLLVERALTRFLLAGHRGLHATLDATVGAVGGGRPQERTPEKRREAAAAVERALVEVMYLTARTYEHSPSFLQRIGEKIRAAGFENLAGSVLLLKF